MSLKVFCKAAWLRPLGVAACLSCALLVGCFEEEKTGVSVIGVNHTDIDIIEVSPTGGRGGIVSAYPHGTSGNVCCITIPTKWRPDLTATIAWQNASIAKLDSSGNRVLIDGKAILIEQLRKSKTVPIPKYESAEDLWIHFFPNDEVKLVVSKYSPGHPKHGLPDPELPGISK